MPMIIGPVKWANVQSPRKSTRGYRPRYEIRVTLSKEKFLELRDEVKLLENGRCTSLRAPDNPETYDGKPEYINKEYYIEIARPVYSADENDDGEATPKPGIVGPDAVSKFEQLIGNDSVCAVKFYWKKTLFNDIKSVQARFAFDDPIIQVREHVAYAGGSSESFTAVEGVKLPEGHTGESFSAAKPEETAPKPAPADEDVWDS